MWWYIRKRIFRICGNKTVSDLLEVALDRSSELHAELWGNWLDEQLYYFLLIDNFRPESESIRALPGELARGELDVVSAIHRIVLSPNFNQRNPG